MGRSLHFGAEGCANHRPGQVSGSEAPDSGGTGVPVCSREAPASSDSSVCSDLLERLGPSVSVFPHPSSPIPQLAPQTTCPSRKILSAFWTRALAHPVFWVSFPDLPSGGDFAESSGFLLVTISGSHTYKRTHISSRLPWTAQVYSHASPPSLSRLRAEHLGCTQPQQKRPDRRALGHRPPWNLETELDRLESRPPSMEYYNSGRGT